MEICVHLVVSNGHPDDAGTTPCITIESHPDDIELEDGEVVAARFDVFASKEE